MRKIEQWLIQVIKASRANAHLMQEQQYTKDNTTVITRAREDGEVVTTIYLHNNIIAQCGTLGWGTLGRGALGWGFTMAGWPTPTTKSRINAIANTVGHPGVFTRKGKHYSGDKQVNACDWF